MGVAPSFWRGSVLLVAAALIVLVAFAWIAPPGVLIGEAVLRGERGPIERRALLVPGERLRLDLVLRRPAALLILLCDPSGKLSEVFPPPGDAAVLSGPALRLPPGDEAWETGALGGGDHSLWLLASPETIPREKRARLRRLIEGAIQGLAAARDREAGQRLVEDLARGLKQESVECTDRWFRIDAPGK
ncbi:MAG: hypothetical protein ACRD2T_05335 [Thermoanaerobaculia bacterium]